MTAPSAGPERGGAVPDGQDGVERADGARRPDGDEHRPLVERIGLAAIAAVLATLFAFVAVASWVSGEAFLAFMGALGAGMTVWLGLRTLLQC